jgi:hypothetical protein
MRSPPSLIGFEFVLQLQRYENSLQIPVPFNPCSTKFCSQNLNNPHSINITYHLLQRCLSFLQHNIPLYDLVPRLFELQPLLIIINGFLSFYLMIMKVS